MKQSIIVFLLLVLLASCSKDKVQMPHHVVSLPVDCKIERICFVTDSVVYACGGEKLQSGYVFKSENAGASWTVVYQGKQKINSIYFVDQQHGYACGDSMTFIRTVNAGQRWCDSINYNYFWDQERTNLRDLFFWNNTQGFFVGGKNYSQGNFYYTEDAGNVLYSLSLKNEAYRIAFPSPETGFVVCHGRIYRLFGTQNSSPGEDIRWSYRFKANYEIADIDGDIYTGTSFLNTKCGWVCGYTGGIYKTEDGGYKWKNLASTRNRYNDILFVSLTQGYTVGEDGHIAQSTDGGNNWKELDCGQSSSDNIHCIAARGATILCGTENGKIISFKQ